MSLTAELLDKFEADIESIELIPSEDGRFEVVANDDLLYSKLATHRHAEAGEIGKLIQAKLDAG